MSTVKEIAHAILRLSAREREELEQLLYTTESDAAGDDEWDRQMKADGEAGRLDWVKAEVEAARKAGNLKDAP